MFIKTILYSDIVNKTNVYLEAELQTLASKYGFSPIVYNVIYEEDRARIVMDKIDEMCLADKYGEKIEDIPQYIWDEIRNILKTLYDEENIEYVDITPYNFIEKEGKVYIIDFEHAYYNIYDDINWFLEEFLLGENKWNPDFI